MKVSELSALLADFDEDRDVRVLDSNEDEFEISDVTGDNIAETVLVKIDD